MVKANASRKDKANVKSTAGWQAALKDAEKRLEQARRDTMEWKAVASVCRKRISEGAPWPGDSAT
jgi:hypothetical protein